MTKNSTESPSIPTGKVGCLLCGGFISVQGGDRARFIDHMSNEHDAKTDCHEVLLALCVMDTKEKGFLVKSSGSRLEEIGKGLSPNYSNSFLNKLTTASVSQPAVSSGLAQRQPAPQHRRGRGRGTVGPQIRPMLPRQLRPPLPVQSQQVSVTRAAPSPLTNVPSVLQGNGSISISKVDQRKKCTMCPIIFPNPVALREHMNKDHLSILGGIIVANSEEKKSETYARPAQEIKVQPPNLFLSPKVPVSVNPRPPSSLNRSLPNPGTPRPQPNISRFFPNSGPRITRPRSPGLANMRPKQPGDLAKCNICSKTVEKSKLAVHKLSHSGRKVEKSNNAMHSNTARGSSQDNTGVRDIIKSAKSEEDGDIEMIEIDVDDGDETGMKNSPLPHESFKKGDKIESDIQCTICEKNFASNMALKMHNNLKHPVKKEVDDTEKLLVEDKDEVKESDNVKNEIEKMETLELLDNLVNFLNDA